MISLTQTRPHRFISTCLTAVRLVSVPRLLLSVMTIAWDNRLDGGYEVMSDLLYTVVENRQRQAFSFFNVGKFTKRHG